MPVATSRWRNEDYLRWVASLPCARCGAAGSTQAHHFKGRGQLSGAGLKAPDYWAMPLCHQCHGFFHRKMTKALVREQYIWVAKTLALFFQHLTRALGEKHTRILMRGIRGGVS